MDINVPPFKLSLLSEALLAQSNVKFYGRFISVDPDHPLTWSLYDRGSTVSVDVSSGYDVNPQPGEWYRILGTNLGSHVKSHFSPRLSPDFDPTLFERCLKLRRKLEASFDAEIVSYASY